MNKIRFLKLIDNTIGRFILLFLPPARRKQCPVLANKILIIRPGGIGDFILLIPMLNALKKEFPESRIYILCEKRNAEIAGMTDAIDGFYLYDKDLEIFKCLRNKYDVVIDTEQMHRLSGITAYLTRAGKRIGFDTNERRRLFTHRIRYSHDDYEAYSFLRLLEPLMNKPVFFKEDEPFIHISDAEKNNIISIFTGASVPERRWKIDNFSEVADIFTRRGYRIVIIGGKNEKKDAEKIMESAGDCIDMTGKTTLRDTAVILTTSRLLVSSDSGLMHLAYAVGTPTVSLFGASNEKKWAPRWKQNITINKHLYCSPCTRFANIPKCKNGIECLRLIKVEEVVNAIETILKIAN